MPVIVPELESVQVWNTWTGSGTIPELIHVPNLNRFRWDAWTSTNLLFRAFVSGNVLILTRAYLTYIRPIVEYCTYFGRLTKLTWLIKVNVLQKYFTRRVLCRTKLSYMERLSLLKLDLLGIRRIKSDLKMCYKIINGLRDIDSLHYFKVAPTSSVTRGHNIKLIKPICSINCQLNFYTNRVVNYWNSLPADIVEWQFIWNFCIGAVELIGVSHETCSASIISICYLMQCFYFHILKWCEVLK